jgi:hypothetical protein
MVAHAEELHLDQHPARKFLRPALSLAALAALVALIRRATREPRVTPMSDQWLASQHHDSNRFDY